MTVPMVHTYLPTDPVERTKVLTGAAFTAGAVLVLLIAWWIS